MGSLMDVLLAMRHMDVHENKMHLKSFCHSVDGKWLANLQNVHSHNFRIIKACYCGIYFTLYYLNIRSGRVERITI